MFFTFVPAWNLNREWNIRFLTNSINYASCYASSYSVWFALAVSRFSFDTVWRLLPRCLSLSAIIRPAAQLGPFMWMLPVFNHSLVRVSLYHLTVITNIEVCPSGLWLLDNTQNCASGHSRPHCHSWGLRLLSPCWFWCSSVILCCAWSFTGALTISYAPVPVLSSNREFYVCLCGVLCGLSDKLDALKQWLTSVCEVTTGIVKARNWYNDNFITIPALGTHGVSWIVSA